MSELENVMQNLNLSEQQQPPPLPVQPTLYSITIFEMEYRCGNTFAICTSLEEAELLLKNRFPNFAYTQKRNCYVLMKQERRVRERFNVTAVIQEVKPNVFYEDSLTGCAGCMSDLSV